MYKIADQYPSKISLIEDKGRMRNSHIFKGSNKIWLMTLWNVGFWNKKRTSGKLWSDFNSL